MIKAIFFDIDGTLLSFRTHRVSEGTRQAFDALRRKGIRTFIASGRPRQIIPSFPVPFDGYITMNGGYVFVGDQVLHTCPIPLHLSDRWLRYAHEHHITTFAFMPDAICLNRPDPSLEQLRAQIDFELPDVWPLDRMLGQEVCQFIVIQPAHKDAEVLQLLPGLRMPRWHPAFSDLIAGNSSKAVGMQKIMDHFGIRREETMAFGDGGNDVEMLQFAGIGVAMGNASEDVKHHADHVTTDVDNEGILTALQTLCVI